MATFPTYIALLRGINVVGKKLIRMDVLKKIFQELNLRNVRTYIQSGNVIFESDRSDIADLTQEITGHLKSVTGFDVTVMILDQEELRETAGKNPYAGDKTKDPSFMHVTFLKSEPMMDKLDEIEPKKAKGEEFILLGKAVYLYLPHGYGRTRLNNSLFESKLKVQATTRNWRTIMELCKMQ